MKTNLEKALYHFDKQNYEKALQLASNIKGKKAYYIMAESYFLIEKPKCAIPYYQCLLKNNIKDPWVANHLSQCYEKIGDYKKAIEYGFLSLKFAPNDNNQHINFAYLLYELNNLEATKKWQKLYSKNPIVSHFSDSILGASKRVDSNPEYVKNIFDNFAPCFDNVLAKLAYKAPDYINQFLSQTPLKKANILDIGCGTGLCGTFLKKYAKKNGITGVDLSPKMLDEAEKKKVYYHLIEEDISSFLSHNKTIFDCIVAADVFTYFGDLSSVFFGAKKALKNNGYFAFTVSKNTSDKKQIFLHQSGRFLHSQTYVKKCLKNNGFELIEFEEKSLRFEGDNPVIGYVVLAQKIAP